MIPAINSVGPSAWPELAKALSDEALTEAIELFAGREYYEFCAVLQRELESRENGTFLHLPIRNQPPDYEV